MSRAAQRLQSVATHRPARRPRRFRHDRPTCVELFSGFGGFTQGIVMSGWWLLMAANHNRYKVEVHEANHPEAEHWIADLVDPDSSDYHDARDLPAADLLIAGISCTNHSQANTLKAYAEGLTLFTMDDPDFDVRVTRSERDRATANCVLHYAQRHRPRLILVECTTEFVSWGHALPGRPKVGDGSTYRWWLKEFEKLGYRYRVLHLNSMFFGVPQSRDRYYCVMWDKDMPAPDLEHRPLSWCGNCREIVEGRWTWKTGVPASGSVRYGKQYDYRCPDCRGPVVPPMDPSLHALDLTNLGPRIGDKPLKRYEDKKTGEVTYAPMAATSMARAERCRQMLPSYPAVAMPAQVLQSAQRHPWRPTSAQAGERGSAMVSTGAVMAAAGNTYERAGSTCRTRDLSQPLWSQTATNTAGLLTPPVAIPAGTATTTTPEQAVLLAIANYQGAARGPHEALPTQGGSETLALVSAGVMPFRKNTLPVTHAQPMPAVTADQIPGLLTAAWFKQNGSRPADTAPHPVSDSLGTLTSRDTTALMAADYRAVLENIPLEDCHFRMLTEYEVGRGCGFDPDFPAHQGTFKVWGTAKQQVDGYGNAVSPPVGQWLGERLHAALDTAEALSC